MVRILFVRVMFSYSKFWSNFIYFVAAGVNPVCMEAIKDIFDDLTKPELLTRCLGSRNQNANENLNSLIWKFCPKAVFAGKTLRYHSLWLDNRK